MRGFGFCHLADCGCAAGIQPWPCSGQCDSCEFWEDPEYVMHLQSFQKNVECRLGIR